MSPTVSRLALLYGVNNPVPRDVPDPECEGCFIRLKHRSVFLFIVKYCGPHTVAER